MDDREIFITIIVTVYNKESDLSRCLKSVEDQTDQRFYIVAIDDGSTDRSKEILQEWEGTQNNVLLLTQIHSGVAAARNLALSLVRTEYVIFLDGDDTLLETAVERLNHEIRQGPCDLTVYGISHLLANGNMFDIQCPDSCYGSRKEIQEHTTELWNSGLMYSVCNKLFHMDLIRTHGITFPRVEYGEDIVFCREYLKRCCSLHMLSEVLYYYTYHNNGSLSTRYRGDLFERRLEEHKQMLSFFEEMGVPQKEYAEYLSRRYIERIIGCVENEQSPDSPYSGRERYRRIRQIVHDPYTQSCAATARRSGWKMKLLILPVRKRQTPLVFLLGKVMSVCRYRFPALFAGLKYR